MSKLISYYFKRDKWILLAMVGCAVLGGLLLWSYSEDSYVGAFSVFAGVMSFIFAAVIVPLWLCIRDYKRMYGTYGSFFAALPLTGREVMGGRAIWFIIMQILAMLSSLMFIGPLLMAEVDQKAIVKNFHVDIPQQVGLNFVVGFTVVVIAGILFAAAVWLFVTSVGSEKPFRRFGIGGPIMLYVALQVFVNVVTNGAVRLMIGQQQFMIEQATAQAVAGLFLRTCLVIGGLMLIAAVVLFLRSVHSHDKKLSVS